MRYRTLVSALAVSALACGGQSGDDNTARDLSLQPAESVTTTPMNDQAMDNAPSQTPSAPRPRPSAPAQPATTTLTLPEGTVINLAAGDTITSRHNHTGDPIVATNAQAITDDQGRVVIPPASIFTGRITDLAPAESPGGEGRMVLTFNYVAFGGQSFQVAARVDSLGSFMKGRGVTAGNVATVGAGAVVGGVAGRIIGGNRTGTIVGAAAGAAAGAGIASATRDVDILLPEGAPIRLVLTAAFEIIIQNN